MSLILAILSASCDISAPPDSMVFTLFIRTGITSEFYHANLLSAKDSPLVP